MTAHDGITKRRASRQQISKQQTNKQRARNQQGNSHEMSDAKPQTQPETIKPATTTPVLVNGNNTQGRLIALLNERGQCSAAELAEALELTPQAVRRHLNTLQEAGWLAVDRGRPCTSSAKRGRPQQLFSLGEQGRRMFMHDYHNTCLDILRHAEIQFGEGTAARIIGAKMRESAKQLTANWPPNLPLQQRLQSMVEVLSNGGYDSELREEEDAFYFVRRRCPYFTLSQEYQGIGDAEVQILSEMLDAPVVCEQRALIDGYGYCRYKIAKLT